MQKAETKPYRVLRQFVLDGKIFGRIDKPRFTEKQVAAIKQKHGTELPIEEIVAQAESATPTTAPAVVLEPAAGQPTAAPKGAEKPPKATAKTTA